MKSLHSIFMTLVLTCMGFIGPVAEVQAAPVESLKPVGVKQTIDAIRGVTASKCDPGKSIRATVSNLPSGCQKGNFLIEFENKSPHAIEGILALEEKDAKGKIHKKEVKFSVLGGVLGKAQQPICGAKVKVKSCSFADKK